MGMAVDPFERAMVVVAHADDAEFGCSGTVATWCQRGIEVVYVLCTDGSKGSSDHGMSGERLAEMRRTEQLAAGKVLGLKSVVFLDYEDAMLQPTLELRRDISREIRRHRPDVLICQYPLRSFQTQGYIGHPDHMAAGEAALSAAYPAARDHMTFPELLDEGFEPHKVHEVWVQGAPEPDLWVDISTGIDLSIQALQAHASQVGERDVAEGMRTRKRQLGEHHGMAYAEAYKHFHLS